MERDDFGASMLNITLISTHTLTWSVTLCYNAELAGARISTHTLTWSVTEMLCSLLIVLNISTHTLTWSVTS